MGNKTLILIVAMAVAALVWIIRSEHTSGERESWTLATAMGELVGPNSSERAESLKTQLYLLRAQLELYQIQHEGYYPDLSSGWEQMTRPTNASGDVLEITTEQVDTTPGAFGPYLKTQPVNRVTSSARVVIDVADLGPDAGWLYDMNTAQLRAVMPKASAAGLSLDPDDIALY